VPPDLTSPHQPVLDVRNISKSFGGQRPVEALANVSLEVERGDFVSIVGPSGCGKSTLFNLIAGIEPASGGEIEVNGTADPDSRRRQAGYMFQKDLLFPWRSLLDNAALGLEVAGGSREAARQRALELLPRFGLQDFESHQPSELSGGMRQRVALLRTLLLQRPLLLLDEPFASLDALTRRELQAWLRDTWQLGSEAAVLVTHDVREAVLLSDRVYVMSPRPGRIVAEIPIERGPDGLPDPIRAARAEEAVLRALDVQHIGI
jgi:ABC-type nitrate/sulfonate/bicarbonate transport system ATPase subunit